MKNKRERVVLPVKPVSTYRLKQLRQAEETAIGSALLAAMQRKNDAR